MTLDMRPLHSSFGVEIVAIDVRRIGEAVFREVSRALDDHSVLLFARQSLTDEEQIAFSERFGPLETTIRTIASQARDLPEISNLSNVDTEEESVYRLVGADEANLDQGSISITSPLARALIGREIGDEVKVRMPAGERIYEILEVEYR